MKNYEEYIMTTKVAKVNKAKFHPLTHKKHKAVPEGWIYTVDETGKLINRYNLHPIVNEPKPKFRDYTIIDHIGSVDNASKAYSAAYELSIHDRQHTHTIKEFCQILSRSQETQVTNAQKNFVRFNYHPAQVILITNSITPRTQWFIDSWSERTDNLTVIVVETEDEEVVNKAKMLIKHKRTTIEYLTIKDMYPEWIAAKESTDSKYRRCANIWGNALGWSFSAPLYRDNSRELDDMYLKRPDREMYMEQLGAAAHITKIASRPESYINAKIAVASEQECKEFYNYYAFLQKNNMLQDAMEPGYQLCPHCGRPIRLDKASLNLKDYKYLTFPKSDSPRDGDVHCSNCRMTIPHELLNFTECKQYFETSDYDRD